MHAFVRSVWGARVLIAGAALGMLAVSAIPAAELNGFVREKGHGDVALSWTRQSYDQFWLGTTKVDTPAGGDLQTDTLSLWVDYGLTDRLTLIANLPYVKADGTESFPSSITGADDEVEGFQDLTVLGKYRFASLGGGTVRHDFVAGLGMRTIASNYDVPGPVDIGDGTANWLFQLVYQLNAGAF